MFPLGLGGMSSILAASLGKYQALFTVATFILLALAHYLIVRQKKVSIANKAVVWLSTISALGIIVYAFVT